MHLGILVGMIWWLCKIAGLMKPARAAVCIVMIALFLLVVPPRAPTMRAAIICFVYCASSFFNRYPNPINTLSLAAIILLLLSPMQLFEPGWQLSFVTVLGLLLFCEHIHFFLNEKIADIFLRKKVTKTGSFFSIVKKPGPYLLRLFSTGLTAWISGAGILLYHFYTINPLTFIWTVLVFPLVAAILMLGFLKMILFYLLPTLSIFLGFIVTLLSDVLIWIVKIISEPDISQILIGHVSSPFIIFYYSVILFTAFTCFQRPLIKKRICTVAVFAIVIFLVGIKWQRTYRDNLIMTCLDVGHGQSILVQLPGSSNILFDAGSMYRSDIGRRIVSPFLDYIGTNKLDAIFISHNDVDHINGIPEIAENCKVRNVYANDDFLDNADQWGTARFLRDCLTQVDLKIQRLDANLNFGSQAHLNILWPRKDINYDSELSDNNKSLVSLIEFADVKILLCSDIEEFAQKELLKLYPDLNPDIVIVPHHGSTNTLDNDFLKKLNADILICSCNQSQYERIIRNEAQTISGLGKAKSFYTAEDGAITISINKKGKINITTSNK
jgi:competence protein ComEC